MDLVAFVAAAVALLAVPGPTNTLLATAGASAGWSRSVHLLAAELTGYVLAIMLLRAALGPLVLAMPIVGSVLRIAVAVYLIHLAAVLWRHGTRELRDGAPVTFRRVLITTLLNPKAVVFASALLPLQADGLALAPWLAVLAVLIAVIGATWIALGASLGRGLTQIGRPELIYRLGAVAQLVLAAIIGSQFLGIA